MTTSLTQPVAPSDALLRTALRQARLRITQPRLQVWRALSTARQPLSAYALQDELAAQNIHLEAATIYRVLQTLQGLQLAHWVHSSGGYVACEHPRAAGCHHHIVCSHCGATAEFTNDFAHDLEDRIARDTGFQVQTHILEFSGVCTSCAK